VCWLLCRCEQLLAQVSSELKSLNLYNILEDCHHDTLIPAGLRAQQQERLAALRSSPHASWPLTGRVQQGKRVHNWATLLGHNPPCTVSRQVGVGCLLPSLYPVIVHVGSCCCTH